MQIKPSETSYKFSILSVTLYAFFLILLVSLGFWQLGRADEKRSFLKKKQQAQTKEVVELESVLDNGLETYRYRQIALTGVYDSQHQFLLDNQMLKGKVGYFVLTPFIIDKTNNSVLVNRGWLPLNKDRRILPDIAISTLPQHLTGKLNQFPSVGILLKDAEIPTTDWPSVVQVVNTQVLSKKLAYSLLPFQIELDPTMAGGYSREWKEIKIMPPEQHIAYAVQWFGLAFTLTLLFLWISRTVDE